MTTMRVCSNNAMDRGWISGSVDRRSPRTAGPARRPIVRRRSGVAMMLVVVAMATVTVLTLAYVTSRDNSPQLGANVADGVHARLAAATGIDLAVAIMECDTIDWRTVHVAGVLLDSFNFGHGTITIEVADLEGNPPTATTEYVVITATGTVGNLQQMARAEAYAPVDDKKIDVDLSEFVVFGVSGMRFDGGYVGRWAQSPASDLGRPLHLGTNLTTASAIDLNPGTAVIDGVVACRGISAGTLIDDTSGFSSDVKRSDITNTDAIPIPQPPTPDYVGVIPALIPNQLITTPRVASFAISRSYTTVTITGAGHLDATYTVPQKVVVTDDVLIDTGGIWTINGQIDLYVLGDLIVRNEAAIELTAGSRVRIFVGGDLIVDSAVFGMPATLAGAIRNAIKGVNFYQDPERVQIYKLLGSAAATWTIDDNSFVCGTIYAPGNDIQLDNGAALFGSVVGTTVDVRSGAIVYYDPALDRRRGYTNPTTRLFSSPGELDDTLVALITSLDTVVLNLINTVPVVIPPAIDPDALTPRNRLVDARLQRDGVEPVKDNYDINSRLTAFIK